MIIMYMRIWLKIAAAAVPAALLLETKMFHNIKQQWDSADWCGAINIIIINIYIQRRGLLFYVNWNVFKMMVDLHIIEECVLNYAHT